MSLNGKLTDAQVYENYKQVIGLIEKLGEAAVDTAQAERSEAEAARSEAETENTRQKIILNKQLSSQ